MKNILRVLLLCAGLATGNQALASCTTTADGTALCGPEPVRQLYVSANGSVYVSPTSSLAAVSSQFGCTPVGGAYFILDPKATNFKELYASLLSAHMVGAPVTFVLDPSRSQCTIAYILF